MTISINGITDLSGNLIVPLVAHFTTANGADTVAPTVLFSSVESGAVNVPVNSVFTLKFSKAMDARTLNSTNFRLYNYSTGIYLPTTFTFGPDGTTATLIPTSPLAVGTQYQLSAYNAQDLSGNTSVHFAISFTTAFSANNVAPVISGTSPVQGGTGVPTNAVIEIFFSEPIQSTALSQVTLLAGASQVGITRSLSNGDRTLTLTPSALLSPSVTYTVSVTGVSDTAGNVFSGTATRTFTIGRTRSPKAKSNRHPSKPRRTLFLRSGAPSRLSSSTAPPARKRTPRSQIRYVNTEAPRWKSASQKPLRQCTVIHRQGPNITAFRTLLCFP